MTALSTGGLLSVAVAVAVVFLAARAGGLLGLEHAVEGGGAVLGEVVPRGDAVAGDAHVAAVLEEDADRLAVEGVAVGAEDVGLRPLLRHGRRGQHEGALELLDRDVQPHPLAGPEAPDEEGVTGLLVGPRLVGEGDVET